MDSYIHVPMNQKLLYESIPNRLKSFARQYKDREAFIFYSADGSRTSVTFNNLLDKSMKFGKGLVAMGLKPGDVVGLALPNSVEWVVCHFGILFAGCISMGLTFSKKNGDDVKYSIEKSAKCRALIFEGTESHNQVHIVEKWVNSTNNRGEVDSKLSIIDGLEFVIPVNKHVNFPFTVADVLQAGSSNVKLPDIDPDDDCIIFQTSGTSGYPKLAPFSHSRLLQDSQRAYQTFGIEGSDIYFHPGFFSWGGGYFHCFLITGCTHVTAENFMSVGDVQKISEYFVDILNKEKCTNAFLFAFNIYQMLEPKFNLKLAEPLKGVLVTGHPMRKSLGRCIGPITKKLYTCYGSTEVMILAAKSHVTSDNLIDFNCGQPIPDTEVKVVNENNEIIPRQQYGYVFIRQRSRFQGYLNDPEKTALVASASGWYNTHDTGYLNENGDLIVFGRKTDLIGNKLGQWFSPIPMETLLMQHKDVKEAVIIPVPDENVYQKSCACIIRHDGSDASWEDISAVLRDSSTAKIGTMEMDVLITDYHIFVESIPRTMSGKIRKNELYEQIKHLHK